MGRPRAVIERTSLTVRLTVDVLRTVDRDAKLRGQNRSDFVRDALLASAGLETPTERRRQLIALADLHGNLNRAGNLLKLAIDQRGSTDRIGIAIEQLRRTASAIEELVTIIVTDGGSRK